MFTVEGNKEYSEQIKKSQFIGNLASVTSPDEVKEFINSINTRYKDATHNCWAYVIGIDGQTCHCSDAGEPSGTAGKPILGALQKHQLSNVVCVVTRYFGGTKLGIRGLIEAYRHITEETIRLAKLKEMIIKDYYEIITDYNQADKLKHTLVEMGALLISNDYQAEVTFNISALPESGVREFLENSQNAGILKYRYLKTEY
jgi:uncharacterized YigZ family protein